MNHKTPVISRGRPFIKQISLLTILICLFFSIPSCNSKPASVLRVATNVWTGYEPLYLARSLGLYDKSSIRLVEMTSASQVSHAIRNGTVEAAALTLDEVLNLLQDRNIDLRVVLVTDISHGADVLIARAEISQLADLKGKKIGVENTATGAIVLDAALQSANLQPDSVEIVPLTVNNHVAAWNRHEIDAVVTFEPIRSELLNKGGHELFDSSQIPGRIMDVLVVRTDAIKAQDMAIKTLIAGYFASLDYLSSHPEDAAARMSGRLATRAENVLPQFQGLKQPNLAGNRQWLAGEAPPLHKTASELAELMQKHHLLRREISINTLAEAKFLPNTTP